MTRNDVLEGRQEPQQVTLVQTSARVRVCGRVTSLYFISSHSCLVSETELGQGGGFLSFLGLLVPDRNPAQTCQQISK